LVSKDLHISYLEDANISNCWNSIQSFSLLETLQMLRLSKFLHHFRNATHLNYLKSFQAKSRVKSCWAKSSGQRQTIPCWAKQKQRRALQYENVSNYAWIIDMACCCLLSRLMTAWLAGFSFSVFGLGRMTLHRQK